MPSVCRWARRGCGGWQSGTLPAQQVDAPGCFGPRVRAALEGGEDGAALRLELGEGLFALARRVHHEARGDLAVRVGTQRQRGELVELLLHLRDEVVELEVCAAARSHGHDAHSHTRGVPSSSAEWRPAPMHTGAARRCAAEWAGVRDLARPSHLSPRLRRKRGWQTHSHRGCRIRR